MSAALAIFVKTPGFSPIKTRLAVTVGQEAAVAFHRLAAEAVGAVARAAAIQLSLTPYWAVAEVAALAHPQWSCLPRLWQGDGGLGERLDRIHRELHLRHERVIFVGADAPHICVPLLARALALLDDVSTPFVLGPASDGGFWLFGSRTSVPTQVWRSVSYSQPRTGAELCAALAPFGGIALLPELGDVDTARDLDALLYALRSLPQPMHEQRLLAAWLGDLLIRSEAT